METKPWKSKTLVVNALFALLVVSGFDKKLGMTSDNLLLIVSSLNMVLRLVTKNKIGLN